MTTAGRALASMGPMFFIYLWRELRRRKRQAVFTALGLALGVGLVITVTAAAGGVRNSQATVLHALYGVGTDLTVTQPPSQGSGGPIPFGFRQEIKRARNGELAAGTKISINDLFNNQYSALNASSLAAVARQRDVTGAAGALTLSDDTVTGTIPSVSLGAGGGSISSDFTTASFTVAGVDLASRSLGPLSSARITAGHLLTDRPAPGRAGHDGPGRPAAAGLSWPGPRSAGGWGPARPSRGHWRSAGRARAVRTGPLQPRMYRAATWG